MRVVLTIWLLVVNFGYSQEIEEVLESRQFVIEAQRITDDEGLANPANRKLCFIMLDSSEIVIQWIADCDNNGLGGITMHGEVNSFELSKVKIKKEIQYQLNLNCDLDDGRVNSDLRVEIYSKSHATARLSNKTSSIFVPKEMEILGKVVPLSLSKVVIGSH